MHTNISWCYGTLIVTYAQLLGNDPPSVATHFSGFVRWLASVPGDCKIIHCLVSLEKLTLKKVAYVQRG